MKLRLLLAVLFLAACRSTFDDPYDMTYTQPAKTISGQHIPAIEISFDRDKETMKECSAGSRCITLKLAVLHDMDFGFPVGGTSSSTSVTGTFTPSGRCGLVDGYELEVKVGAAVVRRADGNCE
jgi:hypothetical protein